MAEFQGADRGMSRGRMKFGATTTYSPPPGLVIGVGGVGANSMPANQDTFNVFFVEGRAITVDRLAIEMTASAAGANIRLGLTALDVDWNPTGAPLCDSGDISLASGGVKEYVLPSPLTLLPGRYATVSNQSASCSSRYYFFASPAWHMATTMGTTPYYYWAGKSRTYGAFPNPLTIDTPSTGFSGAVNNIGFRVVLGISTPDAG